MRRALSSAFTATAALKFGLYGDRGKRTCHHYNSKWDSQSGSNGHEEQDAKKLAEWGVDYWKYDNCDSDPNTQEKDYTAMSKALRNSGRDIVFSICMWEYKEWMPKIANLWRTTFDIGPEWISTSWYRGVYEIIDASKLQSLATGMTRTCSKSATEVSLTKNSVPR